MSDRRGEARKPSDDVAFSGHRTDVYWFEKGLAAFCLIGGAGMAYFGSGIGPYVGAGLVTTGVFVSFEKARPLISGIVDRLPFLKSKPKPEQIKVYDGLEEE